MGERLRFANGEEHDEFCFRVRLVASAEPRIHIIRTDKRCNCSPSDAVQMIWPPAAVREAPKDTSLTGGSDGG